MNARQPWAAWASGAAVFAVLQAAGALQPGLVQLLARTAAWLAASLLGVPLEGGVEPIVAHPGLPVQVVTSCSGWSFFCLLAALLVGRVLASSAPGRRALVWALLALPLAAAITVLANAGRFVAVVVGGLRVLPHLPVLAGASFHTAIGVAVFLPALIMVYVIWERRICHA